MMPPRRSSPNRLSWGDNIYRRGGWRGQLERVKRWHGRLRTASADDYPDFLYAFFQNCNHLADWVVSDAPGETARVQKLVDDTAELRLGRDICNATKHHMLDRQPRSGGFTDGREYAPEGWPTDHAGLPIFFISGGHKYDSLKLADRCMAVWDDAATAMANVPSSI